MPTEIPLERPAGTSVFEVSTLFGDEPVRLRFRWNVRANGDAGAWFMDVRDQDERPVILGVKLVLGVNLCRRSAHPIFQHSLLRLVDTSRTHREATLDDLGTRVVLLHYTTDELFP